MGGFLGVPDEICCDADLGLLDGVRWIEGKENYLGANVAELSGDTEHQFILFTHRLIDKTSQASALLCLKSHIGISDFRERTEEEDDSEEEDEGCNSEVCPLDFAQVIWIGVGEEDAGCEERGDD